jgi:hypothetical protein
MGKMKTLRENILERDDEIQQLLTLAYEKRPAFYDMVINTPSIKTVTSLLRGITDDLDLILLVTGYLSNYTKKS